MEEILFRMPAALLRLFFLSLADAQISGLVWEDNFNENSFDALEHRDRDRGERRLGDKCARRERHV